MYYEFTRLQLIEAANDLYNIDFDSFQEMDLGYIYGFLGVEKLHEISEYLKS